jgi:hypothetical protein
LDNDNWFDEGVLRLQQEIAEYFKLNIEDVKDVYVALSNYGLIDYDTEKEIIWNRYFEDEEE